MGAPRARELLMELSDIHPRLPPHRRAPLERALAELEAAVAAKHVPNANSKSGRI
jgi:hypothetical protein